MWKSNRRKRREATHAVLRLVHWGVVEIRAMAYRRSGLHDKLFPGTGYQEQIHLIADTCDTLVGGLAHDRRHDSVEALQYTWDTRGNQQRRWMRETLTAHGIDLSTLVEDRESRD